MVLYELSFPIYIFILPVILLLLFITVPGFLNKIMMNQHSDVYIKKLQLVGCMMILVMSAVSYIPIMNDYKYIAEQYSAKNYCEVVGYVENFSPLKSSNNQQETFFIGDVTFSYGFAGSMNIVGYQTARSHGGIIEGNGQHLKIRYVPYNDANIIVYIEQNKSRIFPLQEAIQNKNI